MPQPENQPRIGSLCSGYGGLDLAAIAALGAGEMAWHAQYEPPDKNGKPDVHQWAAQILAHRFPGVPNHGDITAIDFRTVEQVDVLTAGFPCTDVSLAGLLAGLAPGTRSGIWSHVARAIGVLRPRLVLIENVRSLTSARAHSDLEPCPWCMGNLDDRPVLRALGAVLGDLADLGFDAEWICLPASGVGACHERFRCFIAAWPATENPDQQPRDERRIAAPGQAPSREPRPDAGRRGRAPAAHPEHQGRARIAGPGPAQGAGPIGEPARRGAYPAAHPQGLGRGEGRPEPAGQPGRPGTVGGGGAPAHPQSPGLETRRQGRPGAGTDFGRYATAVARWETVTGHPAPEPRDARGRLAPAFTEWMMGLPPGWVTAIPKIPRAAQLKALGNGVVPAQGAAAFRTLIDRAEPLARIVHELTGQPAPQPWTSAASDRVPAAA